MPVYNGDRHLRESIRSILSQTFREFEFIIVDDGSTDDSVEIVQSFKDSRIQLISNTRNEGLARSLNRGLDIARGEYVIRMDADDISLPRRISVQVDFMDSRSELGAAGTWIRHFDETGRKDVFRYSTDPKIIRCEVLFDSPLGHPTVIIRKNLFQSKGLKYDETFPYAQDYDLWSRATEQVSLSNIPRVLLLYRKYPPSERTTNFERQQDFAALIRRRQLGRIDIVPTDGEFRVHQALSLSAFHGADEEFVTKASLWLQKLKDSNGRKGVFPEPFFSRVLGGKWLDLCYSASGSAARKVRQFFRSSLSRDVLTDWNRHRKRIFSAGFAHISD